MYKKQIFCFVGETNSGKDTIVNRICEMDKRFSTVISYTSRPKRDNETDGVEHHFVDSDTIKDIMTNRPDDVVAYTKISQDLFSSGYEYLATIDELDKGNIYIIDPHGIEYLRSKFGDIYEIIAIYIYAPLEIRRKRAKNRSDYTAEFAKRVENESVQFDHYYRHKKYDYIIYNIDGCLDAAVTTVYELLTYIIGGGLRRECTSALGNIYTKKEIYDGLTYLKMIFTYYLNNFTSRTLILEDIQKKYEIMRNIILSHLK